MKIKNTISRVAAYFKIAHKEDSFAEPKLPSKDERALTSARRVMHGEPCYLRAAMDEVFGTVKDAKSSVTWESLGTTPQEFAEAVLAMSAGTDATVTIQELDDHLSKHGLMVARSEGGELQIVSVCKYGPAIELLESAGFMVIHPDDEGRTLRLATIDGKLVTNAA